MPIVFRQGAVRVYSSVLRFSTGTLTQSAGEAVYTPPGGGGGGTLDHAALTSNLAWSTSAHTGTVSNLAGFSGAGAAAYYTGSTALDLVASTRGMIPVRGAATWSGLTVGAATYLLGSDGTDPLWRSPANAKTDLSLNNVENTALSTWTGSTNLTTLGTIGTGTWQGSTLALAYGGTGATTASGARTNLGLAIGTNVQAWDADLDGLAALGNGLPYRGAGVWGATALGDLAISGASVQVTQARGLRETSGPTTLVMGAVAAGELLIRSGATIIGAAIGTVVQAYSAILTAITALSSTGFIARTGAGTVAARTLSAGAGVTITNPAGVAGDPVVSMTGGSNSDRSAAYGRTVDWYPQNASIIADNATITQTGTTVITKDGGADGRNIAANRTGNPASIYTTNNDTTFMVCSATARFAIRTNSSALTGNVYKFGFSETNPLTTALTDAIRQVCVVYRHASGHTTWHVVTYDTSGTDTDTTVAIAADTVYFIRITIASGGASVAVGISTLVAGVLSAEVVTTVSATLPAAGTKMGMIAYSGATSGTQGHWIYGVNFRHSFGWAI